MPRTTQQTEEIAPDLGYEEALQKAISAFQRVGKVKSIQEQFGRIVGSVGSRVLNMNTADVTVRVEKTGGARSKIVLTATAQEGVILQNTAARRSLECSM